MEIDSSTKNQEKTGIRALPGKIKENLLNVAANTKKVGKDDPRRLTHAAKVGLALTIVSLLYYFKPLYNGFGQSGMRSILTVVVVFEFTVGGTVSKCLNRGLATFIAGALGIGAEHLAGLCGEKGDPIVLGVLVFVLAAVSTFIRFFPHIKRRYDYGVLIFILTFSLVTVSGYRVEEIIELAHQRISTILIGVATCMIISVFICPVWTGEDLHNLILGNIHKLASFLRDFGGENSPDEKSNSQVYKSVLNTKATEESLANSAWWEPGHGSFRLRHPWKQYLKIGVLIRECAFQIEALSVHKFAEPKAAQTEIQGTIRKLIATMSLEAGKALSEIASSVKETRDVSSSAAEIHVQNSKSAMDELTSVLRNSSLDKIGGERTTKLAEIVEPVAVASILFEIIKRVEKLSESVKDLGKRARFKPSSPTVAPPVPVDNEKRKKNNQNEPQNEKSSSCVLHRGTVKPIGDGDHVIIPVCTIVTCRQESAPEFHETFAK